jgi:hypothetical protein
MILMVLAGGALSSRDLGAPAGTPFHNLPQVVHILTCGEIAKAYNPPYLDF